MQRRQSIKHWKIYCDGYWHHFLDFRGYALARRLWGEQCIVELAKIPKRWVQRCTWRQVCNVAGGRRPILVRERDSELDHIFQRTRQRLYTDRYCLVRYNCEHFAHECMTGRPHSNQVQQTWLNIFGLFTAGSLLALSAMDLGPPIHSIGVPILSVIVMACSWNLFRLLAGKFVFANDSRPTRMTNKDEG